MLVELREVCRTDLSLPQTDFVAIEETYAGTFRPWGASGVGARTDYYMPGHFSSFEAARIHAQAWAVKNDVGRIYVIAGRGPPSITYDYQACAWPPS